MQVSNSNIFGDANDECIKRVGEMTHELAQTSVQSRVTSAPELSSVQTNAIRETLEAFSHDYETVIQLIELFLEDALLQIQRLSDAAHSGDLGSVEHYAHMVRSSSAAVGAMALSQHCADVEKLNRLGTLTVEESQEFASLLREEFNRVQTALLHHVKTGLLDL